nr:MAG TPA: hypothetical protein [Caudoviricetes sp.]
MKNSHRRGYIAFKALLRGSSGREDLVLGRNRSS